MDQELVAYLDRRFAEVRGELRGEIVGLRGEIAAGAVETRRHFDVVAEALMAKIQVVAVGVIAVDEKLGRFRGEVGEEFRKVERRFLHLEARIVR